MSLRSFLSILTRLRDEADRNACCSRCSHQSSWWNRTIELHKWKLLMSLRSNSKSISGRTTQTQMLIHSIETPPVSFRCIHSKFPIEIVEIFHLASIFSLYESNEWITVTASVEHITRALSDFFPAMLKHRAAPFSPIETEKLSKSFMKYVQSLVNLHPPPSLTTNVA